MEQEQYFNHADGAYKSAIGSCPSKKPFSLRKLEKNVKFVLVEVMPKVIKVLLLIVPVLLRDLMEVLLPAKKKSINGQLALVTGGGNGLGRALCLRFAQEGCSVAVSDIDIVSARRTAEEVRARFGVKAEAFQVDVGNSDSVTKMKEDIESTLGPVDILVNNAALLAMLSLCEGKAEDVQRIINVNLLSHFWTIRAFKDGMVERRRGHIVAISSVLAFIPFGRTISYCVTKVAVRGLMAALEDAFHMDGLSKDLHTTCVYPTGIRTRKDFVDLVENLNLVIPFHTPDYVANAIVEGVLANKSEIIPGPLGSQLAIHILPNVPKSMRRLVVDVTMGKFPVLSRRG